MKIAIIAFDIDEAVTQMMTLAFNAGVQCEVLNIRPLGNISFIPCIAALDDTGFVAHSGDATLSHETLQAWAAESVASAAPVADLDGTEQRNAMMARKAKTAARAGDYAKANYLLSNGV